MATAENEKSGPIGNLFGGSRELADGSDGGRITYTAILLHPRSPGLLIWNPCVPEDPRMHLQGSTTPLKSYAQLCVWALSWWGFGFGAHSFEDPLSILLYYVLNPSGFCLGLANGEPQQKIKERG